MSWIYRTSDDNKYRYALGEIKDTPDRLLFCIGINPSKATPEKLDPTANRIDKIAKANGYDSWIILNISAQIATDPNEMNEADGENTTFQRENIEIINALFNKYGNCSDILFAYGDLIGKRPYLEKYLCEIINVIKTSKYGGNCYCLGKTKAGNARHPLYQKASTPLVPYSLAGHTYSEFFLLEDNRCVIRECDDEGNLIFETLGMCENR